MTDVIYCSVCGEEVTRFSPSQIVSSTRVPSFLVPGLPTAQIFAQLAREADALHMEAIMKTENEAHEHLRSRHRLRYWIWNRYGWVWPLRKWLFR